MKYLLVVDDNPMITSLFKQYPEKKGYAVATTHSGPDGLEVCQKVGIDALITDYRMSGMNGVELMKQARCLHPFLPVIFISAYGKEIGVPLDSKTIILNKPVQFDKFGMCLDRMICDANTAKSF